MFQTKLVSIVSFFLCCLSTYGVDNEKLLKAIAEVETGYKDVIGKAGERSIYQITYGTWKRYTNRPFIDASLDAREAKRVALAHLERLKIVVERRGWEINAYNLALLWNGGENRKEFSLQTENYAQRVAAIYNQVLIADF